VRWAFSLSEETGMERDRFKAYLGKVPSATQCKEYIESCGYRFQTWNRPWYIFRNSLQHEVVFTLGELRDTFKKGW
jgi:hypothetical protein